MKLSVNIYVLIKQTFDTEEKIIIRGHSVSEEGAKFVINPYDEYAVEEAIRLKEKHGGRIIVLSAGPPRAGEALRTVLAMGADEAVLLHDDELPTDEYSVSQAIAAYLKDQAFDVLLGGNFSVDNGAGQVAVRTAQMLGIPHVSAITKLEIKDGEAITERDAEGDAETIVIRLPALFTAQQGLNEPRYPTLPGIMKAKKKPFKTLSLTELGLSADQVEAKTERVSLSPPPSRGAGRILQGEITEQTAELIHLLRSEAKIF